MVNMKLVLGFGMTHKQVDVLLTARTDDKLTDETTSR